MCHLVERKLDTVSVGTSWWDKVMVKWALKRQRREANFMLRLMQESGPV